MNSSDLAAGQVLVLAQAVSIAATEEPTVEHLVQVVQVVLGIAVALVLGSGSALNGQAQLPSVVLADSLQDASTARVQSALKVLGTGVNVEPRVFAVSTGSTTTLVRGDLHETLLTVAAGSGRVAGRFLHGEGHEDGSGDTVSLFGGLEGPKVVLAGSKDGRVGSLGGRDDLELIKANLGRVPTTRGNTTVEETLRTVGLLAVGVTGTTAARVHTEETSSGGRRR